jgi:hypothetical protein
MGAYAEPAMEGHPAVIYNLLQSRLGSKVGNGAFVDGGNILRIQNFVVPLGRR